MPGFNLSEAVARPLSEIMGRSLGHVEPRVLPPLRVVAGEPEVPPTTSFRAPAGGGAAPAPPQLPPPQAPTGRGFGGEIPGILRAIKEPAVPEVAQRGTAESPELYQRAEERGLPVRQFATSMTTQGLGEQYQIDPQLENTLSKTYDSYSPWEERVQKMKSFLGGFFTSSPNMPKDIKSNLLSARTRLAAADEAAARDMAAQLSPLTRPDVDSSKTAFNTTMLFRQMKIADTLSYMDSEGATAYQGIDRSVWEDANNKLLRWIKDNPNVQEASANVRSGLDEIFNDMVSRGWIIPDRYREQYTPMRKINSVLSTLGDMTGETADEVKSRILSSMRHRPEIKDDIAIDEGNLLHILSGARSEYYRKIAEHELFQKIINDPTINMTERYRGMQTLPATMGVYFPGRGMMGNTALSEEGRLMADMAKEVDPESKVRVGGWILPKPLIEELQSFHPTPHTKGEEMLVKGGRKIAKWLTVYNPANTTVNLFSDALVAMMGLPGEKARPLGFLRWYGEGMKASQAFVKGDKHFVTINGQKIDVTNMMLSEGVGEATLVNDLSDRPQSSFLRDFLPKEELKPEGPFSMAAQSLENIRRKVELYPRIAAGLEALERTGDIKEFGRVARNITLNFGPGSPKMTRVPILRFMSPFLSFQGLATERVFKSMTTEGSRARMLAGIIAVPAAMWMWNNQNDEFKIAARSLRSTDKSSLPLILSDPRDSSKPLRDEEGKYVAIRFKYWVPEEVMKMVGLGNLPNRIARIAEGRDTPADFLGDMAKGPMDSVKNLATIPSIFIEQMSGKSALSGKDMSLEDRITRLIPVLRTPYAFFNSLKDAGLDNFPSSLLPATKSALVESSGMRPMSTSSKVGHAFDSDLQDAIAGKNKAQREWEAAAAGKDKGEKVKAAKNLQEAIRRLNRISAIVISEDARMRAASGDARLRDWDAELRGEYIKKQSEEARDVAREELRM